MGLVNRRLLVLAQLLSFFCWSRCNEEGREKLSRDVTDFGFDTFQGAATTAAIIVQDLALHDGEIFYRDFLMKFIKFTGAVLRSIVIAHNRSRTPFALLILASDSSKCIMCTKPIAD